MNFWYFKSQIICFMFLIYLTYCYIHNHSKKDKQRTRAYLLLLTTAFVNLGLDIATVYTVNHLETVNSTLNMILHLLFIISIPTMMMFLFQYIMELCGLKMNKVVLYLPYIVGICIATATITELEYRIGNYTNYSMGYSAYALYGVGYAYFIFSIAVFVKRKRFITKRNQQILLIANILVFITLIIQTIFPEVLITCFIPTFMLLVLYQSMENGIDESKDKQQRAMIHALADIVESRDNNTGGHIKRTSKYVELIAQELRKTKLYDNVLSQDYIDALILAAPMHDIGKVAIPDKILQKQGKLTNEEYEIMKTHTTEGARLIEQSLKIENDFCKKMIYEVVYYHHEKWNGKGYPTGKKEDEIPLGARIMAVADVFDAVSQNRCYREAMSLDESFEIIRKGIGTDFDPSVVQCFLNNKDTVIKIYNDLHI